MYSSMISDVFNFLRRSNGNKSFSLCKNYFASHTLPPHPLTETTLLLFSFFSTIFFLLPSPILRYFDRALPKQLHLAFQSDTLYTSCFINLVLLFLSTGLFFLRVPTTYVLRILFHGDIRLTAAALFLCWSGRGDLC